jgi:hypothetical protein
MLFGHDIPIKLVRLIKMCLYETWSRVHVGQHLSYMFSVEECWLRVFENRVLRRIFGPKRNGVTGGGEKPMRSLMSFTECAGDLIEKNEMGGSCSSPAGGRRCAYRVVVGNPEGKRPLA